MILIAVGLAVIATGLIIAFMSSLVGISEPILSGKEINQIWLARAESSIESFYSPPERTLICNVRPNLRPAVYRGAPGLERLDAEEVSLFDADNGLHASVLNTSCCSVRESVEGLYKKALQADFNQAGSCSCLADCSQPDCSR